jgi:hypothetical protein
VDLESAKVNRIRRFIVSQIDSQEQRDLKELPFCQHFPTRLCAHTSPPIRSVIRDGTGTLSTLNSLIECIQESPNEQRFFLIDLNRVERVFGHDTREQKNYITPYGQVSLASSSAFQS